jgi:hypothetical protein
LGKIHIYDVSTGSEIKVLNYPTANNLDTSVIAVTPADDKIYLVAAEEGRKNPRLLILDISSNTILSTIDLTSSDIRVVFFEE